MSDLMDKVEITATADDVNQLVSDVIAGYQEYIKEHPEADYSNLIEDFLGYLKSPEAQQILSDSMKAILESAGNITGSKEQLQQLVTEVMAGYQSYAAANGYTGPDKFDEYLLEYLSTGDAQAILTNWAENNFKISENVTITQEQLAAVIRAMRRPTGWRILRGCVNIFWIISERIRQRIFFPPA